MTRIIPLSLCLLLAASGCAVFGKRANDTGSIPCHYRFKMLSRSEDQMRVEAAIQSVAVGTVTRAGTAAYPEYRFRVARLADLDTLHPKLMFVESASIWSRDRKQALNLKAAEVGAVFDSTDVSASAATTVTLSVKPGSRLYYKMPGGTETEITSRVDRNGQVRFPVSLREGQKFVYVRAVKDNVTRYIRVNLFTNELRDLTKREYR